MYERGKTAIILTGGGMRSAHGAGFLYALATRLGITSPDIMIGSSGNAGNVLYFVAGQFESTRRIWNDLLSTAEFISPMRFWRIMDIDYLVDTVFKQEEPLDVEKVQSSRVHWYIPLSDYDTGKTFYASAQSHLDPFEILRAAKSIPIFFGRRIPLKHRRYIDGELGPVLQDHLDHAIELGARNILIVNNTARWTFFNAVPMQIYTQLIAHGMHDAVMRDTKTAVTTYQASGAHIVLVSPSHLPCGTVTSDRERVRAAFNRGVEDALAQSQELRTLFA